MVKNWKMAEPLNIRKILPRKVALLLLGLFIAFCLISLPQYFHEIHSVSWPTTNGIITISQVHKGYENLAMGASFEGYLPDIHYNYNVGGVDFEGTHINFHLHQSTMLETNAERWVKTYPSGKIVFVYYNPKDAQDAVLIPGIQNEQRGLFYLEIGFIVISVITFILVFLRYEKPPPNLR